MKLYWYIHGESDTLFISEDIGDVTKDGMGGKLFEVKTKNPLSELELYFINTEDAYGLSLMQINREELEKQVKEKIKC